ncbi:MAG: C1 family peptidase [Gammaproteobacteria bacterium]
MAKSQRFDPQRNVVPDQLDLRDRLYLPSVAAAPPPVMKPKKKLPVLDQKTTNACTGFALASVVNFLQRKSREARAPQVSPYMLYSMARRYDEFPGASEDTGSSLRGAMKGWYKHGACRAQLWRALDMPPPAKRAGADWWLDAAKRPLGAYYRVDTRSVTDMQVALHEVGVLYASAICHAGWLRGSSAKLAKGLIWIIPRHATAPDDGGHAFVIVGYNSGGFMIQNSWGSRWGTGGLAVLAYGDWLDNAMDCWVAQVGVVTELHLDIAKSVSLRVERGKVQVATEPVLRNREISPFIINMENNGRLSNSGEFRTQPEDVKALVSTHLTEARKRWGLGPEEPTNIAVYAHGGLTGEETAAKTAAQWIPALYAAKIFPIFFMWETGLFETLKNRLQDLVKGLPKPTAGLVDQLERFWNQRLERLLAPGGTLIWGEMKQNADAITAYENSGGRILYQYASNSPVFGGGNIRLHLIGHSAGAIAHSYVVQRLAKLGWKFESVNFMAPAVTVKLFQDTVLPKIKSGAVKRFRTFHLTDEVELQDTTCRPILGYGRSLLYLVSESFENGVRTPLVGMEKYFDEHIGGLKLKNIRGWSAPMRASASSTHGGFDEDRATMRSMISLINKNVLPDEI